MEDTEIVELYWSRSESAIAETSRKYGRYCYAIAFNILSSAEDADESVNDTYLGAWNSMPPHRPSELSTFLGKLTRRISIDKWRRRAAGKRGGGEPSLALEELAEVVSSGEDIEKRMEQAELAREIDRFLSRLPESERDIFVCRYWFFTPVSEISERLGISLSKVKSSLFRTRGRLREYLEGEGC